MNIQYFSEANLDQLWDAQKNVPDPIAYHLRSPMPQVFLVTADARLGMGSVCVRTTRLTPLSWVPYTMAVSIPNEDQVVVDNLSRPHAECVMALPTCRQLRQVTLCSQLFPRGISEVQLARFKMFRSQTTAIPGIEDCPVNFECRVEHIQPYYGHMVAFLKVTGASINADMLFKERQEIVDLFPTNLADQVVDKAGNVQSRVSLMGDMFLCPTFPVAPKQGWYAQFDIWVKDLFEEGYFSREEYEQVIAMYQRWEDLFSSLDSLERLRLRENLTGLIYRMVREDWTGARDLLKQLR